MISLFYYSSIILTIIFISFQNSCLEPQDSTFEIEFIPEKDSSGLSIGSAAAESPSRLKLDIEVEHDFIEGTSFIKFNCELSMYFYFYI